MNDLQPPVALVTGAARRIGCEIARHLHQQGFNLVVHYRHSKDAAAALVEALNQQRENSAIAFAADLSDMQQVQALANTAHTHWQRLDLLVNNASSFYPSPLGNVNQSVWDDLMASNLKAPFFLAQALAPALEKTQGSIINISDIYGERPLRNHSVYCIAKAGNLMLTKALAAELAPQVRVNGIAPGAILWPEQEHVTDEFKCDLLAKTPLQERGQASDIARAVVFLAQNAPYMTGQIITVDGGRSLTI